MKTARSHTNALRPTLSLLFLPLMVVLAGCTWFSAPEQPSAVGVVISPHAHSAQPDISRVLEALEPGLRSESMFAIVESDGVPSVVQVERMPNEMGFSSADWESYRSEVDSKVRAALEGTVADYPETAPLEAITKTVRQLDPALPRIVHYMGSGLQTTGSLPMHEGQLYLDPADIAEFLEDSEQLPDLSGVTIHLHGLGSVAGDQPPLDLPATTRLEALWVTVLERAGATVVLEQAPLPDAPAAELPPVSIVQLRESAALPGADFRCERTELGDAVLSFQPDSAEYVDPIHAHETLSSIAQRLEGCPGPFVVLAGTSSAGTAESRQIVATARTERVAEDLAAMSSLDRSQFTTIPAAMDHCGFTPDRDASGQLLLDIAATNRMVVIFAAGNPDMHCL